MTGHENTVEELRELIVVGPKIERVLRAFARANVEDAYWIDSNLKFRQAVVSEFNRLLREGPPVPDLPEVEETESGGFVDAVPLPCQNLPGECGCSASAEGAAESNCSPYIQRLSIRGRRRSPGFIECPLVVQAVSQTRPLAKQEGEAGLQTV